MNVHGHVTWPVGTPGYMAPEMFTGKPYTQAVDQWSLGVVMNSLLSGQEPVRAQPLDHYDLKIEVE